MKSETFLANDVVVHAGGKLKAMYIVSSGIAAVYQKNGTEVIIVKHKIALN